MKREELTAMNTARQSRNRASWTAAGNEVPRRFGTVGNPESGVAAALCHRSPNSSRPASNFGDGSAKSAERETHGVPPLGGQAPHCPTRAGWAAPDRLKPGHRARRASFPIGFL